MKLPELSCGKSGAPQASGSVPCHGSNQVSAPNTFSKEPSALNTYSSSNKHARVVTSAAPFDHQETSFLFGPTPNAPAVGDSFQVPSSPDPAVAGSLTENTIVCSFVMETSSFPSIEAVTLMV